MASLSARARPTGQGKRGPVATVPYRGRIRNDHRPSHGQTRLKWAIVPAELIYRWELSMGALRVLIKLGQHLNMETGTTNVSSNTIAQAFGIKRQAVDQQLKKLQQAGYIEVERRFNPNGSDAKRVIRVLCDFAQPDDRPTPERVATALTWDDREKLFQLDELGVIQVDRHAFRNPPRKDDAPVEPLPGELAEVTKDGKNVISLADLKLEGYRPSLTFDDIERISDCIDERQKEAQAKLAPGASSKKLAPSNVVKNNNKKGNGGKNSAGEPSPEDKKDAPTGATPVDELDGLAAVEALRMRGATIEWCRQVGPGLSATAVLKQWKAHWKRQGTSKWPSGADPLEMFKGYFRNAVRKAADNPDLMARAGIDDAIALASRFTGVTADQLEQQVEAGTKRPGVLLDVMCRTMARIGEIAWSRVFGRAEFGFDGNTVVVLAPMNVEAFAAWVDDPETAVAAFLNSKEAMGLEAVATDVLGPGAKIRPEPMGECD